jgi:ABC-type microcin C transport system permease subunit YejE
MLASVLQVRKKAKRIEGNIPNIKDCNGRPIIDTIEKANFLITTILRYSSAIVTFSIYSAPTQANPSPVTLKSLGKRLQRSGKTNR